MDVDTENVTTTAGEPTEGNEMKIPKTLFEEVEPPPPQQAKRTEANDRDQNLHKRKKHHQKSEKEK